MVEQVLSFTHLFSLAFGKIGLWGIDELLNYHYPKAEFFRSSKTTPREYWKLSKTERSDAIGDALPFGCWWFLNNPSIVEEITSERIEFLGTSLIPQHSDARVLEQAIYKWRSTRLTVAPIRNDAYLLLLDDGGIITKQQIQTDVNRLFPTNFEEGTVLRTG